MNRATFFKHFELLAGQPDAVARMRELVWQLAVRGKLVKQIAAEQKDDAWQKFLKKFEGAENSEDLPPFKIPEQWRWVRLDDVADYSAARKVEPSEISDKAWVLDLEEIEKDSGRLLRFATFKEKQSSSNKAEFIAGDVLYGKLRPYLNKVLVAPKAGFCTTEIVPIRSRGLIVPAYLCLFLRSPHFVSYTNAKSYGMKMPRLGTEDAVRARIAVPPLAEQRRIVSKVDELMALCDELGTRQQARHDARARLTHAALHHLTAAKDTTAIRQHFNFILHHSSFLLDDVPQLRQAILSLAVQGRLFTQEPKDEPASKLLARIRQEKARLVENGKIQKEKPAKANQGETALFSIPETWQWTRLSDLAELITKGSSPKWQGISYVTNDEGVLFITSENVGNYRLRKLDDLKYVEKRFNEIEPRSMLRFGDVLMNLVGASIGRTAVYNLRVEANINQAVALIRLMPGITDEFTGFLLHYLNSPSAIQHMLASQVVNAQPNISLTDARDFPIPVPPLAEQKRIVARVEELMRLCEALEAQLSQTRTLGAHLLESTLQHLLAA